MRYEVQETRAPYFIVIVYVVYCALEKYTYNLLSKQPEVARSSVNPTITNEPPCIELSITSKNSETSASPLLMSPAYPTAFCRYYFLCRFGLYPTVSSIQYPVSCGSWLIL